MTSDILRCKPLPLAILFLLHGGVAEAQDIELTPSPGGAVSVRDPAGTVERFRVEGDGRVYVPGLSATPTGTDGVCHAADGQLIRCDSIAGPAGPPGPTGATGATGATGRSGGSGRRHRRRGADRGDRSCGSSRADRGHRSHRRNGRDRRDRACR